MCLEFASSSGLNQLQCTRKVFFWGLVFTAPLLALLRPDLSPAHLAAPDLLFNVLYLGVGASAICFVLWNKALSLLGSVSTNVYIYLTPVVTLFASALILHEPVTLQALAAIALILAGLWLSQRKTGALSEEASASPSSTLPKRPGVFSYCRGSSGLGSSTGAAGSSGATSVSAEQQPQPHTSSETSLAALISLILARFSSIFCLDAVILSHSAA